MNAQLRETFAGIKAIDIVHYVLADVDVEQLQLYDMDTFRDFTDELTLFELFNTIIWGRFNITDTFWFMENEKIASWNGTPEDFYEGKRDEVLSIVHDILSLSEPAEVEGLVHQLDDENTIEKLLKIAITSIYGVFTEDVSWLDD